MRDYEDRKDAHMQHEADIGTEMAGLDQAMVDRGLAKPGDTTDALQQVLNAALPPLECLRSRCDKIAAGFSLVNLTDTKERRDTLRAKLFVVCREIGFTDKDRHELSIMVVGKERSPSWARMTYQELERVADHLMGWIYVDTIFRDRRAQ